MGVLSGCNGADKSSDGETGDTVDTVDTTDVVVLSSELAIPPLLDGTEQSLSLDLATHEFMGGVATATYGYNGSYLGPTLIWDFGDTQQMHVTNGIEENTTTHWHGGHVAPEDDGGPHTTVEPGETWSPSFEIQNRASTMWYHPHPHGQTTAQVNYGAAGMIIVRDAEEAALALPRTYGTDDIPLIIQDRTFQNDGSFEITPLGEQMVVNGVLDPWVSLPAQVVRLRALNGSNQRTYQLGMSDNRPMQLIGTDLGLLEAPVEATRLQMAPGERFEILLDLSADEDGTLSLMSYASELAAGISGAGECGGGGGCGGGAANPLNGVDFQILEIRVGAATSDPVTTIPGSLVALSRWAEEDATVTRQMVLAGGMMGAPFTINGVEMDASVINETVTLGDIEIWEIENNSMMAHPFHLHDVHFFILDRNGVPPAATESGPKDTVLVKRNEKVRFITQFLDHADPVLPYMYHCHILPHEDGGMMGQFLVVEP
jgi:bilirubin oxidase